MATKKKQCSGTKGYSCGRSCISVKKVCRKDGLAGQSVKILNNFVKEIESKPKGKAPLADNDARSSWRARIIDVLFDGDLEAVAKVEKALTKIAMSKPVKVAIFKEIAEKINNTDGLLKNQHEVNDSNGFFDPKERAKVEALYFGYSGDKKDYPKYGFIDTDKEYSNVSGYGDEIWEAITMPYEDYTVTFGDSLESETFGSRANDVKVESVIYGVIAQLANDALYMDKFPETFADLPFGASYIEAQMGGKVDFKNNFKKIADVQY